MTLIPAADPAAAPASPPEGAPPAVTPPAEGTTPAATERPDYIPEELWGENGFNTAAYEALKGRPERAADVPADENGYTLPAIDGFDAEEAANSPLMKALRKNAHANGLGQAAFEQVVTDYVAGETAKAEAFEAEQRAALGSNAETRLKTLGNWLDSSLPADQAAAVRAMATTAAAVAGLEALMNDRAAPKPRMPAAPAVVRKTREEITALMATKEYRGKPSERNPAVVKEVEDWFAADAAEKAKKTP